jgi:hypothetical protein
VHLTQLQDQLQHTLAEVVVVLLVVELLEPEVQVVVELVEMKVVVVSHLEQ